MRGASRCAGGIAGAMFVFEGHGHVPGGWRTTMAREERDGGQWGFVAARIAGPQRSSMSAPGAWTSCPRHPRCCLKPRDRSMGACADTATFTPPDGARASVRDVGLQPFGSRRVPVGTRPGNDRHRNTLATRVQGAPGATLNSSATRCEAGGRRGFAPQQASRLLRGVRSSRGVDRGRPSCPLVRPAAMCVRRPDRSGGGRCARPARAGIAFPFLGGAPRTATHTPLPMGHVPRRGRGAAAMGNPTAARTASLL